MSAEAPETTERADGARGNRRAVLLPGAGLAALTLGVLLIGLLHLIPPSNQISPVRRTISEYALGENKWIFDTGVLLVALGSVAVFAELVRRRRLGALGGATLFAELWVVSLLVLVAVPKHNWAVGPSSGGTVHRIASVVGFLCLPVAVLLACRALDKSHRWRAISRALAIGGLLWFGVILFAIGVSLAGGGPWWQVIPLGLVERLLALTEVLAIAALAVPLVHPGGRAVMHTTSARETLRVSS